jgi:hypothetical protein
MQTSRDLKTKRQVLVNAGRVAIGLSFLALGAGAFTAASITRTRGVSQGTSLSLQVLRCSSNGANGMARMPSSTDDQPSVSLRQDEYDCIRYYVYKLAGN